MRRWLTVFGVLAAVLLVAGVAWAAIPHSTTGAITGCYRTEAQGQQPKGATLIIDEQAGETCPSGYATVRWEKEHTHHQWTRQIQMHTGPVAANGNANKLALCPDGEILLGGGFVNHDPANLTVTRSTDFIPIPRFPQGHEVSVRAGPNGSQHELGATVDITCGVSPD
jgi:hypothetical protein